MKKLIIAITLFNASLIVAQTDANTAVTDSTKLANLLQQKKQIITSLEILN